MVDFGAHAAAVASAYGLPAPDAPMRLTARGEQARIWRLDTGGGSFAVKEPLPGFAPRADGIDVAFQDAVRLQTAIEMPTPVRRPDGALLATVGAVLVRVATWVDLEPVDRSLDPTRIGSLLAALHRVDFPCAGDVDPWYRAGVGADRWIGLAKRLEKARAPFARDLDRAIPTLVALEGLLEAPRDIQMCHCDLWADNVLRTASGGLCVIDWDNCGPADVSHELGMVVYEFGQGDPVRMRTLYRSYVDAGGPGRITRPEQLTMVVAQLGHFWEWAAESWLDPETSEPERRHQEDRVAELVADPLTVAQVEALVTALT